MSARLPADDPLQGFVGSAPGPQRVGMRVLLALARRPRGRALLGRSKSTDQLAQMLVSLGYYDDPRVATGLGYDAEAVVARGRKLRQAEGRP
ncbi:MAG TPA: hypothetical protein VFW38_06180 [Solirubrobacteraceae bacterium]|nr:hypothetical protein [Solirubrobacteraceae bacterium]